MNTAFNLSRFGKLFAKHTAEHYKAYLMSWLVVLGSLLIYFTFRNAMMQRPFEISDQVMTFGFAFIFAGILFTSYIFADLGQSRSAIASLTLPASALEKFMVKWVYTYIIFQGAFILAFYLALEPSQKIAATAAHPGEIMNILHEPGIVQIFLAFAILHALAMLGALLFKKLHFVKTAFVMLIVFVVFTLVNKQIMQGTIGIKIFSAVPFVELAFEEHSGYYRISIPEGSVYTFYLLTVLAALIIWAAAYFRLKEKQV